jgi:IS30 family transposase
MPHHHFTDTQRLEISILRKKKYSLRQIAKEIGCHFSSISRELTRNRVKKQYDGAKAKLKAYQRRRYSKYQGMKVRARPALQKFIVQKLNEHWTPDQVAGHLKTQQKKLPYISSKGIYKWLYTVYGQQYCSLLCSQQLKPRKRRPKAERSMIPNRIGIEKRPEEANNRSEYGHYETDTIVSGKRHESTAALSVVHERKSRYVRLKKIPNLQPSTFSKSVIYMMIDLQKETLTHDNGIECRHHEVVAATLNILTFFCNRYHSWEKGGVEKRTEESDDSFRKEQILQTSVMQRLRKSNTGSITLQGNAWIGRHLMTSWSRIICFFLLLLHRTPLLHLRGKRR